MNLSLPKRRGKQRQKHRIISCIPPRIVYSVDTAGDKDHV